MADYSDFIDISIEKNGGLLKKIVSEGTGTATPQPLDQVCAHYTGTLDDGTVFDSSRTRNKVFEFSIGQGQVIKGWDEGFATMKKGEKAILRCSPSYAYGSRGSGPTIPPNATLNFDVELLSFGPKKKEKWELTKEEKIIEATKSKEAGTELFKQKLFSEAITEYNEAIKYGEDEPELEELVLACSLNACLCCINLNDFTGGLPFANEVLKKDPGNVKGLYRRGVCRLGLGMPEEAADDFSNVILQDPDNKAAKVELAKAKKSILDAKKKEKSAYGNFFSKVSMYDDKELPVIPGTSKNNPKVFFDISIGGEYIGRIIMLLYADTTPKTAENFRSLCEGDNLRKDTYAGSGFHRIIKGFMA